MEAILFIFYLSFIVIIIFYISTFGSKDKKGF